MSQPPRVKPTHYREADLVGQRPVSPEQAERNRQRRCGVRQARPAIPGRYPFSSPTLWRMVRAGTFPAPVKLAPRVTAWRTEDLECWENERARATK